MNGVPVVKVKDRSVGEWKNWTLIGSSDRSEELANMPQDEVLSQKPLLSTAIKFDYDKSLTQGTIVSNCGVSLCSGKV